jgi:hypothetical protein
MSMVPINRPSVHRVSLNRYSFRYLADVALFTRLAYYRRSSKLELQRHFLHWLRCIWAAD